MADLLPTRILLRVAGMSFRQLDYWVAQRFLTPTVRGHRSQPHLWAPSEIRVAVILRRLVLAGIPASTAAVYARMAVDEGLTTFNLGSGITITIERPEPIGAAA